MAIGFLKSISERFTGKPIEWDDLEEMLIRADLGVPMMRKIMSQLQARGRPLTTKDVSEVTRDEVARVLPLEIRQLRPHPARPKVILMVGVNGTGKTTSTAKLAHLLKKERHSVMLVAADTFRAAAIEQLEVWAERIGVDLIKGQYNADPAALCYDAYVAAERKNVEFLICDTAGRLHTKTNLMGELNKVKRSLAKHHEKAPDECWLVVDATTGSNALQQAREFNAAVELTGVIVTKIDGSGKGGVVIAIQNELGIPTRYVGTGEKLDDFAPFHGRQFIADML